MPLRILNVARYPVGGIRSYLRYTYSRLPAGEYSTTVVTVDLPEARLLPYGMAPLQVDLRLVREQRAVLRLAIEAHRALRSRSYDVIHSQGTTAAIASWPSGRWHRIPHVVTLHETFRAEQFLGMSGRIKRQVLTRVFSSVEAVIAVSNDARANLLRHVPLDSAAAGRVHVIRNGVAIDTVVAEAAATRPNLRGNVGIPAETALLGYVGRFMPEKGFDVLLGAVRLLHQRSNGTPDFVVVAVNDGAFVREYRKQIADWGLESRFLFAGFQSSAAGMLTEVDAVVVPSRREACPLVAMEAMVLGCPLIASDCIGLRELTAGGPALTSRAADPESLAASIEDFLRRREQVTALAKAYVPTARMAFDATHTSESLTTLFDHIFKARDPRASALTQMG